MNILHVFRAPVGGLFRHVRDLARGQKALGHSIGLICDSTTGGASAEALLETAAPYCELGIHRTPMPRLPGLGDIMAVRNTRALIQETGADVAHGHGAKGGLYARLGAREGSTVSIYTAHGGSLHYRWASPAGLAFLGTEWLLARRGSGIVFVCEFERNMFQEKLGLPAKPNTVAHNGLWPEEFDLVTPLSGAADVVFVGEMRALKGVDLLLHALSILNQTQRVTACLAGDGPELEDFKALARKLKLTGKVTFAGRLPAREAFTRGRLLVIPSRAESFPYIVLEAGAAQMPILAAQVGGVPEILPADMMSPAVDARALARRIALMLATPDAVARDAQALRDRIRREFSAQDMARRITAFYSKCGAKARAGTAP
jgi:glycosyltransferase involved in cell wall biosynthesis